MRPSILTPWLAGIFVIGLSVPSLAAELRVAAGAAPLESIFKKIQTPFEKKTGIALKLAKGTPGSSLRAIDEGKADIASVAIPFDKWVAIATKEGFSIATRKDDFKYRVIGHDLVAFVVNPASPVSALTAEQLQGILSGKTRSWSEVGGPSTPIELVLSKKTESFAAVVREHLLPGDAPLRADATVLEEGVAGIKDYVKSHPAAIAFIPHGAVDASVREVRGPSVGHPVLAVTKGNPTPDELVLFDFIVGDGSRYVK